MTEMSTINPTQPVEDSELESAPVRDNFVAAYNDINNIYSEIASINVGTLGTQNANSVAISGGQIDSTSIGATTPSTGAFTNLTVTGNFTPATNSILYDSIQQVSTTALLGNPAPGNADITEIPINPTLDMSSGTLGVVDNTSTQKIISAKNGSDASTRHKINFIEGTDISLTVSDDSGNDRTDVTINSTSAGAISSVSNLDGTLTVSPTTGAVVASLNLTNTNVWTGKQTFNSSAPVIGTATASRALVTDGTKQVVSSATTDTEIGYVNGVTSSIQSQLDGKQASGSYITSLTGDVTASGPGAAATTIGNNKVTNAMLSQMATHTIKGNAAAGSANAADLTSAQTTAILDAFVGDSGSGGTKGLVPAPATGDATKFLRGDGTFVTVSGSGTVTQVNTGTGLTGGPITTTGTISIDTSAPNTLAGYDNSGIFSDVSVGTGLTLAGGTLSATGGGGSVSTTGSPSSGNLTKFSGASTITNGDLSGDVTTTNTLATTVAKIQGTAVSGTTGSVNVVFSTSPTLITPALGTPTALVGTNITGTAAGLTAGTVTTNANLTGAITSTGNTTSLGSFSSASLSGALTDETGSGSAVFATSPALVTPDLGTPSAAVLTNATGTASGLTAGTATVANTISSANEAADTTCFPLFITASGTQSLQAKNNTSLTFNSNTGELGSTSFSGAGTGLTGTAASLTAGTVTTNANLTGVITSAGNATSIASQTGTGTKFVVDNTPTLITPVLGVATGTSLDVSGVLESGVNGATGGQLKMFGSTSGDVTLKVAAAAGTATNFQLPADNGTNTYVLQTNGSGVTSWVPQSGGGAFNSITSGTNTTAAMVVGSGATLSATGTGTITATAIAVGGITGLGTGVATFLATPSSANLITAVTDETGSGSLVFATSPTLVTPVLGTPSSGTLSSCTGQPKLSVTAKTTTYLATSTDDVITVSAASSWTLSLPTASGITGKTYWIKKTDANSTANFVTIDPNGSETIDGLTTYPMYTQNETLCLTSNGTNWIII